MLLKELLNRISVPLVDSQSLHNIVILVQQLDARVSPADVANGQPRELVDTITLHKCLNLWEPTQFSSAHMKFSIRIFGWAGLFHLIFLTAL